MGHDHDHGDMFAELVEHMMPVLEESPQAVYLWLDDEHMWCNEHMAKLFGYASTEEWAATGDFLGANVDAKDQQMYAGNYGKHVGHLQGPIRFKFKARKKDGSTFNAETDMIPLCFGGHPVAYHFVRAA